MKQRQKQWCTHEIGRVGLPASQQTIANGLLTDLAGRRLCGAMTSGRLMTSLEFERCILARHGYGAQRNKPFQSQ